MNEKLEQELLSSIEMVKEYVTKGASFAKDQAPLIVEEIIRFNLFYSGMFLLISILLLCLNIPLYRVFRYGLKGDNDNILMPAVVTSIFLTPVGVAIFCYHIRDFVMCLVAPRLFIIEYLKVLL